MTIPRILSPSLSAALRRGLVVCACLLALLCARPVVLQCAQPFADDVRIPLTDEESAWVRAHPVIRVFQDPGWPPVEFADDSGRQIGITSDYLQLIERRLGIRFERVVGLNWQEAYHRMRRWEIDMTTSVAETSERLDFWAFTQPYMNIPIVIATLTDVTYVGSMREMVGKKVAVVEGYAPAEWIARDFPAIQLVEVPTVTQGLEALQRGQVFALIDNMLVVGHYLTKMKVANIKIAGQTPYVNAQRMAVRKDWPMLAQVLQKGLDSIGESERAAIYQKWVPIRYEYGFNYKVLGWAAAIFVAVVLGLVVWNYKLAGEIRNRKRAEAELAQSEERLRVALDGTTDGIWDWDIQTGRMYFSPHCATMLGYPAEEYPATYDESLHLFHPEDLAAARRIVAQAIAAQSPFAFECRMKSNSGGWRWILNRGNVVAFDAEGKPARMAGTQSDITARKLSENALERSEEQLALAIEGSGVGLWDWHIHTDQLVVNPRWAQMLGYTLEELAPVGRDTRVRLTHGEDLARSDRALRRHLAGDSPDYECEVRMQHKLGHWVWILVRGKVVEWDTAHRPVRMTGTHLDITERKNLEAQFLQAQKMESVGRLAGGVAHDFNNMLAVIIGNADMALEMIDPQQALYDYLEEIQKAGRRSAELTRQLLAFARKQTIAPKVLDLNDTVVGMLKLLRRLVGEEIDLEWRPGADLWPVKIDPAQLDQILANLCVNARDAITGVGRVVISTQNRRLHGGETVDSGKFTPGDYVMLAIHDTGCGMSQEVLDHLYEPFFTTKGLGKGTGLGLATVYGIIKQNDGVISVESAVGRGTTITVYLPKHGGAEPAQAQDAQRLPLGQGQTVLLVEDEPAVLALGRVMLQRLGYAVLTAATPQQALALVQTHRGSIHLLLTDIVMPEMNGRELAARMSAHHPDIRCLFMSGYTADILAPKGVLDDDVLFIQKPFSRQDLAQKIASALAQ